MPGQDYRIPIAVMSAVAGAYTLTLFRQLPPGELLPVAILVALLLCAVRRVRIAAAFAAGFCVMWVSSAEILNDRLEHTRTGREFDLSGEILSFPVASGDAVRFIFAPADTTYLPHTIRLTWYEPQYLPKIGELWHLRVRLQRPRGLSNPGGFDYSGWLFRQGIGATGFVVADGDNRRRLAKQPDLLPALRQRFVDRVGATLPHDSAAAVLMAIGVGARHGISRQEWDVYASTGTSHLMAISGLHIGLAAAAFFWLSWLLLSPFCQRICVRDVAVLCALLAAVLYAAVSGFAVPARRALLMLALFSITAMMRRQSDSTVTLAVAALAIFAADPLSILSAGFRMSFVAVSVLLFGQISSVRQNSIVGSQLFGSFLTGVVRLFRLQVLLLCGLFPLSILVFDRFAIAAPIVNMLVLPVFNFISVPFCLFGLLCDGPLQAVGDLLLRFSYDSIKISLLLINSVATEPRIRFETAALSPIMIGVAIVPVTFVVLPQGWPGRKIAFLAMLAVLIYKPATPPQGCADYTVLDVGQGLAIVVQTNSHSLIYDTGPLLRNGNDLARLVVLPFVRDRGLANIDKVIISHADLDHAGGLYTILKQLDVDEFLVGEQIDSVPHSMQACQAGMTWEWDSVSFRILHPQNRNAWDGNNISCVLLIEIGTHRLLLTGDIESPVETLLAHRNILPPVSAVVVPHHGSGTSSGNELVVSLEADLAIVSAGFANRWGMPKVDVVRRWKLSGSRLVNTATSGALSQRLCNGLPPGRLARSRIDSMRYWHDTAIDND